MIKNKYIKIKKYLKNRKVIKENNKNILSIIKKIDLTDNENIIYVCNTILFYRSNIEDNFFKSLYKKSFKELRFFLQASLN